MGERVQAAAHARRKFFDALASAPEGQVAPDAIRDVYRVEHEAKERGVACTDEHLAMRKERSRPFVDKRCQPRATGLPVGYGIAFHGTYEYEDVDAAQRAVSAARENLAFEAGEPDADLAESVRSTFDEMIVINGASIRVQVDEYGPPGLYPIYEMIIETLAEAATIGLVTSRMEGEEVEYPGGPKDD